jgi:hypothetical protein
LPENVIFSHVFSQLPQGNNFVGETLTFNDEACSVLFLGVDFQRAGVCNYKSIFHSLNLLEIAEIVIKESKVDDILIL